MDEEGPNTFADLFFACVGSFALERKKKTLASFGLLSGGGFGHTLLDLPTALLAGHLAHVLIAAAIVHLLVRAARCPLDITPQTLVALRIRGAMETAHGAATTANQHSRAPAVEARCPRCQIVPSRTQTPPGRPPSHTFSRVRPPTAAPPHTQRNIPRGSPGGARAARVYMRTTCACSTACTSPIQT